MSASRTEHGGDWQISFADTLEAQDGEIVLHVAHSRVPGWETQVVALRKSGEEVKAVRTSTSGMQTTLRFAGLALPDIQEFRFQVRPYQWTEFRSIMLQPVQR